jgi:EmrB/QacA subfamily drug resistance transporter
LNKEKTLLNTQVTPSSVQTARQPDSRRWLMLAIVLCAALMAVLDSFIVNVAIPSIERELHASFAQIQLVVAGYTLAFAVLLVTGGRLGDLYGRKRLFLLGVSGFTIFSALCGLAPNAILLIVSRILQGASAALMFPQVLSFIQVSFDHQERARAFGYYGAITGFASILGQVLGGFLLTANLFNTGWRSIFLINVPIGVVTLLAALLLVRESRSQESRDLDYGGVVLLTLTLFLLVFPLVQGGNAGWPLWALICLLLFVPSLIAFLAYEQRRTRLRRTPLVPLVLFRQRRFSSGILTVALAYALFAATLFLFTFYLQTILDLIPLQAGLVIMASSIAFILASSLNPVVAPRLGKRSLTIAVILVTLSYLLIFLAAQLLVPLWGIPPILVALFALGFGMGSLVTPLLHKTLEEVVHHEAGTASGVYMTAFQTAGALGVAVIGLIDAALTRISGSSLHAFVLSMLVITLLSLGLSFTVRPLSKPLTPPTESE